jgi:8-amino-7-oxononanoate synthase
MSAEHRRALSELAERGRYRHLAPRTGVDFSSNDYLGLAESDALRVAIEGALARGVPIGAGGSRLLRGNHAEHEALEAEASDFFGAESALFFASGFLANVAIFATLPQRGDLVVYDELVHASAHDGMRLGRAERVAARHNDAQAFDDAVRRWRAAGGRGRPWVAVETLYSMDGDRAPLDELAEVARRHDGMLVIDEAHATGVLGPDGRGLGAKFEGAENVVTLHTCGKALGVVGALVCASRDICDFIVNRGRPFIFATAPSPLMAAAVRAALDICRNEPQRREALADLVEDVSAELTLKTGLPPSGSQILPIVVGGDVGAVGLANAMQRYGYDIRAIRPPTVPEGTARLRIALTLNTDIATVRQMIGHLAEELGRLA